MSGEQWCGYSAPFLGRCSCGDAANHEPGGIYYKEGRLPDTAAVPDSGQPKRPCPADYAEPTEPVSMFIVSGGTVQRVERVMQVSFATGRVLITCYPDVTPRWVSLAKPRTVVP